MSRMDIKACCGQKCYKERVVWAFLNKAGSEGTIEVLKFLKVHVKIFIFYLSMHDISVFLGLIIHVIHDVLGILQGLG